MNDHGPLGYMLLAADGLHNLIGGLAVGSAFVLDAPRLAVVGPGSVRLHNEFRVVIARA